MVFSFIEQRISQVEGYIKGLDRTVQAKTGKLDSKLLDKQAGFSEIFNKFLDPKKVNNAKNEQHQLIDRQADASARTAVLNTKKKRGDSYGLLPEGFEEVINKTTIEIAEKFDVELSRNLVKSLIRQESNFDPNAKSAAGAEGLMQLMPSTAKEMGVYNSWNPYQNLKGGVTYLAKMMKNFDGNIQKALAAYNAGPEAVKKYRGIPPFNETKEYVSSIMSNFLYRENGYKNVDITG